MATKEGKGRDPWVSLAMLPHVEVSFVSFPERIPKLMGLTDGHSLIEIDYELDSVGRRCVLDHELAHIELGHVGGCTDQQELATQEYSARRLLPIDELADAYRVAPDLDAVARECNVIRQVLDDRLRCLTAGERARLQVSTERDPTADY